MEQTDDERFMRAALEQATIAFEQDEIPVGAVVVSGGRIVARAYNYTEHLNDVTAHAEMQALTSATAASGGKYLTGATLYVTLEPCLMCAGALAWSQISRIVFGASDPKKGYMRLQNSLSDDSIKILHPKTEVVGGVLENECSSLLKKFLGKKRIV
ncbi:MAG: nucleoside deaminase [Bacteroidales bacterium]|nr:nucleoside deaminase [Bacteroidales bacterium]